MEGFYFSSLDLVYTQAIILNSSTSLLEPYLLPVSRRLKEKCEDLYNQEQTLKHATRLESSEREDLESNLMKVFIDGFGRGGGNSLHSLI